MRNLIALIILAAFISCKNTSDKALGKAKVDSIKVESNSGIRSKKIVNVAGQKIINRGKVRNEEATKMNKDLIQKAIIDLNDSSLFVYENIRADYRIFGYQQPDTNSKKLICFSVFTSDVKDNPYNCSYGSYYYTGAMQDKRIKIC